MPLGFGRPSFLRHSGASDRATDDGTMPAPRIDADTAPVGPPVLIPAAITRRVLIEATEVVPIWAQPRPAAEALAASAVPAPVGPSGRSRTHRVPAATKPTNATTASRPKVPKPPVPKATKQPAPKA